MQQRFTSTTFLLTGALLAWLADFVFVYVFAAVACARGFAVALVPAITTIATLAAAVTTVWLLRRGYRTHRAAAVDEHSRFIAFVTLATSVIALVAFVMLVLPPLLIQACPPA